jgi:hypothetical protein
MQIRRPIAALLTALALFGGGISVTACEAAGEGQSDGTTDEGGDNTGGSEQESEVPDNSNQQPGDEDDGDDQQDPD